VDARLRQRRGVPVVAVLLGVPRRDPGGGRSRERRVQVHRGTPGRWDRGAVRRHQADRQPRVGRVPSHHTGPRTTPSAW
jgi:hypothetical protein